MIWNYPANSIREGCGGIKWSGAGSMLGPRLVTMVHGVLGGGGVGWDICACGSIADHPPHIPLHCHLIKIPHVNWIYPNEYQGLLFIIIYIPSFWQPPSFTKANVFIQYFRFNFYYFEAKKYTLQLIFLILDCIELLYRCYGISRTIGAVTHWLKLKICSLKGLVWVFLVSRVLIASRVYLA